jgi:hypothetical protein
LNLCLGDLFVHFLILKYTTVRISFHSTLYLPNYLPTQKSSESSNSYHFPNSPDPPDAPSNPKNGGLTDSESDDDGTEQTSVGSNISVTDNGGTLIRNIKIGQDPWQVLQQRKVNGRKVACGGVGLTCSKPNHQHLQKASYKQVLAGYYDGIIRAGALDAFF